MLKGNLKFEDRPWKHTQHFSPLILTKINNIIKRVCVYVCALSCVWFFVTPRTVASLVPMFMEFSRQEYWKGLPFPFPIKCIRCTITL